MENICNLFISAADKYPANIAIIEKNRKIDYKQLKEDVMQTASYYRSLGIETGDRALVFIPMSIDLYRVVLALFYIGATAVFLDEWVSTSRMLECAKLAKCKALIGNSKVRLIARFYKTLRKIPVKPRLSYPKGLHLEMQGVSGNEAALITFTTGSVGRPKAALRTHTFLREQFNVLKEEIRPNPADISIVTLPIVLFINLATGCTSVLPDYNARKIDGLKPENIIDQIKSYNVNRLIASPYFIRRLSEFSIDKAVQYNCIRSIFTGGAPVFPTEAKLFVKAFPNCNIQIVYGSTEAEPISGLSLELLVKSNSKEGLAVGKVNKNIELKIIKIHDGHIEIKNSLMFEELGVDKGEIGEIIVRGNHVLKKYFNSSEGYKRNKIVVGNNVWHRTGDSGFINDNGELFLTGRCKQLLKYNGKLISPFIYENQLQSIKNVALGTIMLVENKIILVIETKNKKEIPNIRKEIVSNSLLKNFKMVCIARIPRDPRHNSKIDYNALRKLI